MLAAELTTRALAKLYQHQKVTKLISEKLNDENQVPKGSYDRFPNQYPH